MLLRIRFVMKHGTSGTFLIRDLVTASLIAFAALMFRPATAAGQQISEPEHALFEAYMVANQYFSEGTDLSKARLFSLRQNLTNKFRDVEQKHPDILRHSDFKQGGYASASRIAETIGRLALLEHQPAEAEVWFKRSADIIRSSNGNPNDALRMERAQAAAMALDGRFEEARRKLPASLCATDSNCSAERLISTCDTGSSPVAWDEALYYLGPKGPCAARALIRAVDSFNRSSRTDYHEALYRAAVFATQDDPYGKPEEDLFQRVWAYNDLLRFYYYQGKKDEAIRVYSDIDADTEAQTFDKSRQVSMLPQWKSLLGLDGVKVTPRERTAKEIKDWDDEVLASNRRIISEAMEMSPALAAPGILRDLGGRAEEVSKAKRSNAAIWAKRGDYARALQNNSGALFAATRFTPPNLPLRVDMGPLPPECPPGRMAEPHCQEWYEDSISSNASDYISQLFAQRASIELALGHTSEALKVDQYSQAIIENWFAVNWDAYQSTREFLSNRADVDDQRLATLEKIYKAGGGDQASAAGHAFKILQLFQFNKVESGLREALVLNSVKDPKVRSAVQLRHDLREQLFQERDPAKRQRLSGAIAQLETQLPFSISELEQKARFRPMSLQDAQGRLQSDEVLLVIVPLVDRIQIMALTKQDLKWETIPKSGKWLAEQVSLLREHLKSRKGISSGKPFNPQVAFELYQNLLLPFESVLGTRRILVSTSGALSELPLALLVTRAPAQPGATPETLRSLDWLVLHHAILTLPSVSSLGAKSRPVSPGSSDNLIAFGNPIVTGPQADALAPIPSTIDEINQLSALTSGKGVQVFDGPTATEGKLKSLDLSNTHVLEFATHSIIAGKWPGTKEPGLVFTTPELKSAIDDGFLSTSEAAQLHIGADVVILSACNTASADGDGGESLSGLALAFIYSGGRSVLASHWVVDDAATSKLVVGTMAHSQLTQPSQIADALADEMRAMINDRVNPQRADPYFWAPFVVVGAR